MSRKKAQVILRAPCVLFCGLLVVSSIDARAALSQKQARKAIQSVMGWSLPSHAVHIKSIAADSGESVKVSAEIQTVFRLRLHEGHWQVREIRVGQDRWEQLEVLAHAVNAPLPS